ncbi:MAG: TM2 domain-containing protein [Lachnospiraceae bacterium]|nr:TM2 domain-containing protein [Lachnospiraceae bacterium]
MKCPNCGAQGNGKYCEYCGAEMPYRGPETINNVQLEDHSNRQVVNNYYFQSAPNIMWSEAAVRHQMPSVSEKSQAMALIIWLFLGIFGGHYFYVGRFWKGILYLFTVGLFGVGWIIDLFVILSGRFKDSSGLALSGWKKLPPNRYADTYARGRAENIRFEKMEYGGRGAYPERGYGQAERRLDYPERGLERRSKKKLVFLILTVIGALGMLGGISSGSYVFIFYLIWTGLFAYLWKHTP